MNSFPGADSAGLVTAPPLAIAGKNLPADPEAFLHLLKSIQVRPVIFIFDVARELPVPVPDKTEYVDEGSIAFSPGNFRPVVALSVLEVQRADPGMPFAEERNEVLIRRHKVAGVQSDSDPFGRPLERPLESFRR